MTCARCGAGAAGAAASPLSLSHLSPTVQRVKNAFSPMAAAASGDLSATTHKDNSNQAGRSSNGALGHVTATNDVGKLQEALRARESQLETQASQLADLDAALRSLQVLAPRPTVSHFAPFLLIIARS